VNLDTFAGRIGEEFRIGDVRTTLVSATQVGDRPGPTGRKPFALEFAGPPGSVLPQSIYRLDHAELGALDIFLVPVASDAEGVRYEAVFT
jgi:hypothetical protein